MFKERLNAGCVAPGRCNDESVCAVDLGNVGLQIGKEPNTWCVETQGGDHEGRPAVHGQSRKVNRLLDVGGIS
jgi:hypothetical protein